MSRARSVILLLLTGCFLVPIIIGASCPSPGNPLITAIVPDNNAVNQGSVPSCIEGFVCVNLSNGTTVPVNMALYVHNGYDPNNLFPETPSFSCCTNPNSQVACPCACTGATVGNCRLTRPQLFTATNLYSVNGSQQTTLTANGSVLTRIRCGDIKTVGAAVALTPTSAITTPADQNGPIYRDDPGGVACGQTVQFQATNLNDTGAGTGGTDLITLIIKTQFSK